METRGEHRSEKGGFREGQHDFVGFLARIKLNEFVPILPTSAERGVLCAGLGAKKRNSCKEALLPSPEADLLFSHQLESCLLRKGCPDPSLEDGIG